MSYGENANDQDGQHKGRARARLLAWLTRPVPLALTAVVLAGTLSLALWLGLFRSPEPPGPPVQPPAPAARHEREGPPVLYEEVPVQGLEDKVKQADIALLQALREEELSPSALRLEDVQVRHHGEEDYHFQVIRLGVGTKRQAFVEAFRKALDERLPGAVLADLGQGRFSVTVDGLLTHQLTLDGIPEKAPLPPSVPGPKMAVVIDDMGEDLGFARGLARLPLAATFSIWPGSSQNREVAAVARKAGREILAHVPMEPKSYPQVKPGPEALFASMSPDEVRRTLRANLDKLPEAVGINNHMGSRFTESPAGMDAVMDVLSERGLFYLDSVTSPHSVGYAEARKAGVRSVRRDVFLDNEQSVPAILHQLRLAESLARRTGRAVAIGHPHAQTLEALALWLKDKDPRIAVVPVSALR